MRTSREPGAERVLVTGGRGLLGRAVVSAFLARDVEVSVVDHEPFPDPRVRSTAGDLRDPAVVARAIDAEPTGVVHLAADVPTPGSVQHPALTYENNVAVTAELLERCRHVGVDRFILASTNAVTGPMGEQPVREDMPLRPATPYAATKAACEMLLHGYASSYGIRGCALRLTEVYGPGMARTDGLVPRMMRAALTRSGVDVYGDGHRPRDLVHLDDAVRAVLLVWQGRIHGPLVVGSGQPVTVEQLIATAREVTGRPLPIRYPAAVRHSKSVRDLAAEGEDAHAVVADIARARGLGYTPCVSLTDGLRGVWDELRARRIVPVGRV